MPKAHNIAGKRFGLLTVSNERINSSWKVKCDCGNEKWVTATALVKGATQSCGCTRYAIGGNTSHGMTGTRAYVSWNSMKGRCLNPNNSRYESHGERGITVCPKWMTFEGFYEDMGDRPKGTSLERRDNDGNYTKGNCYWATPTEQASNTRQAKHITLNGVTDTQAGWARRAGIKPQLLTKRLKRGWSPEEAIFGKSGP
jgi:hypothetical protein